MSHKNLYRFWSLFLTTLASYKQLYFSKQNLVLLPLLYDQIFDQMLTSHENDYIQFLADLPLREKKDALLKSLVTFLQRYHLSNGYDFYHGTLEIGLSRQLIAKIQEQFTQREKDEMEQFVMIFEEYEKEIHKTYTEAVVVQQTITPEVKLLPVSS